MFPAGQSNWYYNEWAADQSCKDTKLYSTSLNFYRYRKFI